MKVYEINELLNHNLVSCLEVMTRTVSFDSSPPVSAPAISHRWSNLRRPLRTLSYCRESQCCWGALNRIT